MTLNRTLTYIILSFLFAVIAVLQYEQWVNDWDPRAYKPLYTQCESVYVRKSPHPCNAGDLIYIDIDVAEKYCTDNIIASFDDSVYCQYNGFREDLKDITDDLMADDKLKKPKN